MLLRDERRNYLVTGVFVLAMLAVLIAWLALLSGRSVATDRYTTRFDGVMGLGDGTELRFEGYRIGMIEDIAPTAAGDFELTLSVRRGWRIPEDSVVRISSSGLLAKVVLNIEGGESERMLAPGDEIASDATGGVFASLGELADDVSRLVNEEVTPLVRTLADEAPTLMKRLMEISRKLDRAASELDHMVSEENHARIDHILINLDQGIGELKVLAGDLGATRARLDSLLASLDEAAEGGTPELEAILADLRQTTAALARHADAIAYNLEASTRNASELSADVRRDPSLLLRGREGGPSLEGEE